MTVSQNGWTSREPPHARIYASWYLLPAWRTLDSRGRDLVSHALAAYRPDRPNAFELSDAIAAAILDCSENTARRVVKACLERGWFVLERRGAFTGPTGTRGRVVSLARYPTEVREAEPQRYEGWRPKKNSTAQILRFTLSACDGERRKNCAIHGAKSAGRGAQPKPRGRDRKD